MSENLWIVRHYDGFDNDWIDVSEPMSEADAKTLAGDKNEARSGAGAGNRNGHYGEGRYFRAFLVDTRPRCGQWMISIQGKS